MTNNNKVGYLSIHYIIKLKENRSSLSEYKDYKDLVAEIQVRTLLQHAWAEIEHDKNYKFKGVLPNDIKRRFYLIAGVLEMMDNEFDSLSQKIDEYSRETDKKLKEGKYNIEIDSNSLEQYLLTKYKKYSNKIVKVKGEFLCKEVVEEVLRFGYRNIQEIDNDLDGKVKDNIEEYLSSKPKSTYIGLLRNLMIIKDANKYFDIAYNGDWKKTSEDTLAFWETCGIENIKMLLEKNNISLQ